MKKALMRTFYFLLLVSLLQQIVAAVDAPPTQGDYDNEEDQNWTCLCDPGGMLGKQNYSRGRTQGFTECSCLSYCPFCPAGQVLDPTPGNIGSCSCVSPLFVVIQLHKLRLPTYTLTVEEDFIRNFASFLQVSPTQVIPVARRNGSVILDIYIFSAYGANESQNDLDSIAALLLRSNSSHNGLLQDSELGPFSIITIQTASPTAGAVYTEKALDTELNGRILLPALILSVTFAAVVLLILVFCLMYQRRKQLIQSSTFWLKKSSHSHSFMTLISQQSSVTESFQVYNNTCFSGSKGCMGRRSLKLRTNVGPLLGVVASQFSYADLHKATQGFSKQNVIGLGGSSSVYCGHLKDGRVVAVKRLASQHCSEVDHEFLLEVELLSRLHHFHLVPLLGYCIENHGKDIERLLVYEFMPNGNLREYLNNALGKESLNWISRVKIALGAARGLEYLHEAANPKVLHRDFKSSNILLDGKWRAKVADFGMATIIKNADSNSCPSSPAQMLGTFGYFAPEYAMMGRATIKSDVFSFGVVLLELISGRPPVDKTLPRGQESLVVWALPRLIHGKQVLDEIVDPTLNNRFPVEDMLQMARLTWSCLQTDADLRPTMTSVVQVLASLIPENARRTSGCNKGPELLNCVQDYSFSREDIMQSSTNSLSDLSSMNHPSTSLLDDCKVVSEIQEDATNIDGEAADMSKFLMRSNSWSPAEYLQRLSAMTANSPFGRPSEEESLDIMKPRLESFWQNNGLVIQVCSPER